MFYQKKIKGFIKTIKKLKILRKAQCYYSVADFKPVLLINSTYILKTAPTSDDNILFLPVIFFKVYYKAAKFKFHWTKWNMKFENCYGYIFLTITSLKFGNAYKFSIWKCRSHWFEFPENIKYRLSGLSVTF